MKILSQRIISTLSSAYRKEYGLRLSLILPDGTLQNCAKQDAVCQLPVFVRARADALQQAVRWGEPYISFIAPEIITWIIPLVNDTQLLGGISGGEVTVDDGDDNLTAINYLAGAGCAHPVAAKFVAKLPIWPQARTHKAAQFLFDSVYQMSSLTPSLLTHNRENALQQRQIAEAIQERKLSTDRKYPIREEQMLLSLMRVGDRNGARSILNDMLAAMFLYSPKLVLIRARAIEMMGFLVRAAIEDNPVQEPLLERHQEWIGHIINSQSFEQLCEVLRHALDNFMDAIYTQGYNRSDGNVRQIMQIISQHYKSQLTLDDIADKMNLSRFHVARLIKRNTGKTMTQHIRTLRVNHARQLLETTNRTYADIAFDLGFADQSYFIKQFREMTGTTPARYRRARQR